jgi:hypothetical protein
VAACDVRRVRGAGSRRTEDAVSAETELEEFDDHLSGLDRRRRDELAGVGSDAVTTLRRLLIQAASARHAVRSLVADAERLAAYRPPAGG